MRYIWSWVMSTITRLRSSNSCCSWCKYSYNIAWDRSDIWIWTTISNSQIGINCSVQCKGTITISNFIQSTKSNRLIYQRSIDNGLRLIYRCSCIIIIVTRLRSCYCCCTWSNYCCYIPFNCNYWSSWTNITNC